MRPRGCSDFYPAALSASMHPPQQRILHRAGVVRVAVVDQHDRHHAAAFGVEHVTCQWGTPIAMDEAVKKRVDEIWNSLGLMSQLGH